LCFASQKCPESSRQARAKWLYGTIAASLAPSSTGGLIVEAREEGSSAPGAAAIVCPPTVELSVTEFVCRGGWSYIFNLTGWDRRLRFPGLGETLYDHRLRLMDKFKGKYWYVLAVGQDESKPDYLKAAFTPLVERADATGVPMYAETASAKTAELLQSIVSVGAVQYLWW
jgi:hypothetical protein